MTAPDPSGAALYAALVALDRSLVQQAKVAWYSLNLRFAQQSFVHEVLPAVLPDLVTAQSAAASLGARHIASYIPAPPPSPPALPDLPALPNAAPLQVIPSGFAGVASDGRPLASLLAQPLIETYVNLDAGMPPGDALDVGFDSIDRILTTQVSDAARMAQSVQMVVHEVTYYVRQVEPGACSRCLLLSGKHFKVNKGFLRHPKCRCFHVPGVARYLDPVDGSRGELVDSGSASPYRPPDTRSARELFDSLSRSEQDRVFTAAGARAIRDGAEVSSVVNARLGMSTASVGGRTVRTTTQGTTRRSSFAAVQRAIDPSRGRNLPPRLMPEEIYRLAGDNRDETMRLLIGNGYITEGSIADRAGAYAALSNPPR